MMGIIISLFTFFAVFLGIFAVNFVITDMLRRQKQDMLEEIEAEMHRRLRQRAQESVAQSGEISQPFIEPQLQHFSLVEMWKRWNTKFAQSGLEVKQQTLILMSVLGGIAVLVIVGFLTFNILLALAGASLVSSLPFLFVLYKRKQRLEILRGQMPDALDMMSRLLKAGQSVSQAIQLVADELQPPISHEFAFCYEQQRLGLSQTDSLHELAHRTGLVEIRIFVMGVLINQQSGGSLSELLDKLSKIIRQRYQMLGQIKALTAEGRMQAGILLALPFFLWFGLLLVNRVYALKLLEHPALIITTILTMFVGALWIRKIVNFDF